MAVSEYSGVMQNVFVAAFQKPAEGAAARTGTVFSPANIAPHSPSIGPTGAASREGHMAATPANPEVLKNITQPASGEKPSVYYYDRSKKQIVKSDWPRVRMWFVENFPRLFSGTRERTIIGIIGANLANMPKPEDAGFVAAKQKLQGAVVALYRQDPAAIDQAIADLAAAKEEPSAPGGQPPPRPKWASDALTGLVDLGILGQRQEHVPPPPSPAPSTPPPASKMPTDPQLADLLVQTARLADQSHLYGRVRNVYEFNKKLLEKDMDGRAVSDRG